MCGIAGIVCFKDNTNNYKDYIFKMTSKLINRGPDQEGFYIDKNVLLGHRRLIVIDPEGGNQPMIKHYNGKDYIIVYNGELYNFQDLRNELIKLGHEFVSQSDTEVLLTSYIEWKENCLQKLNGIYAFAICCPQDNTVFLARDHLGVKPLFYYWNEDIFAFCSEIKGLLTLPFVSKKVDKTGIFNLLAFGPSRIPFNAIFKDIVELPPAHCIVLNKEKIKIYEYWQLKDKELLCSQNDLINEVQLLVKDAVKRQLVADVPVCFFLSGGLDSGIISFIASEIYKNNFNKNIKTFSIDYENNKYFFMPDDFVNSFDTDWALKVSKYTGSEHKVIYINNYDLFEFLKHAVISNDLPGMADIDSSLYLFCSQIKKEATVALSGECADEIFCGYPWYWREEYKNINFFSWIPSLEFRSTLLAKKYSKKEFLDYAKWVYDEQIKSLNICEKDENEKKHKILYLLNLKYFMQTLLNRKDRMSMAHGLEVRVPFADYRIVELLYNTPKKIKYLHSIEKGLLREAFRGYIPDEILFRKKSPYPKTFNPQYLNLVLNYCNKILEKKSSFFEIIDYSTFKDLTEGRFIEFPLPYFGQLMKFPQLMAHLIQIYMWLDIYNVDITS